MEKHEKELLDALEIRLKKAADIQDVKSRESLKRYLERKIEQYKELLSKKMKASNG